MTGSHDPAHFERLYQWKVDPWDYLTSEYETAKYRHTLSVLGPTQFSAGLEVGCSIGVLTRMLAARCDSLLALDVVDQALQAAQARCADQPWVRFARLQVPSGWPDERFDLIVLSEVLYFFTSADIDRIAAHAASSLLPGGRVLLVNWLGRADDPNTGEHAAARFIAASTLRLAVVHQDRRPDYRLDLLAARD
ncbi:MAG: SAM-dependent methyltransferase [Acetobacteraceae bacterium]